ncbi:MAG: L-threonylcarbamoyladenylate synthase [Bacteroidia bacterium]|nr:L-threonylcarbamoyladenylate synthase [Bacteroidia bacterium]
MEVNDNTVWDSEDLFQAVEVLRQGGVILYPTDTIWGIGCDATNRDAVERVYRIKERPIGKSMLILVADIEMAEEYTENTPDLTWEVMKEALDPLTLIFPHARNLAANLPAQDDSIGIRLPKDQFCLELICRFGKPIVSSSANRSNEMPPQLFIDIPKKFIESVDYVVRWRQDDFQPGTPSTVVRLGNKGEMEMIRP